jgi:hypothetical protein
MAEGQLIRTGTRPRYASDEVPPGLALITRERPAGKAGDALLQGGSA